MHARLARLARQATVIQLLCGSTMNWHVDIGYVSSKVLLQSSDRQQALLKAFLAENTSKISPKQNLVTFGDGHRQRRCSELVLIALICNYLTALVILVTASTVKTAV